MPIVPVQINGVTADIVVVTGTSADILGEATFNEINHSDKIQLQPPMKHLFRTARSHNSLFLINLKQLSFSKATI